MYPARPHGELGCGIEAGTSQNSGMQAMDTSGLTPQVTSTPGKRGNLDRLADSNMIKAYI